MKQPEGLVQSVRTLAAGPSALGLLALGALALGLLAAAALAWPIFSPEALPRVSTEAVGPSDSQRAARATRSDTALRLSAERVTERSPFYPKRVAPPAAAPAPPSYEGPQLIAMFNDVAWFGGSEPVRLRVGDAEVNGLSVVELRPPWEVVVRWRSGEYTVPLFERHNIDLTGGLEQLKSGSYTPTPAAPAPAPAPANNPGRPGGGPGGPRGGGGGGGGGGGSGGSPPG